MMASQDTKRIVRYFLAVVTIVVTAICFRTVYVARNVSQGLTTLPWNEVTNKSIDIQMVDRIGHMGVVFDGVPAGYC